MNKPAVTLAVVLVALPLLISAGEIYRQTDSNGQVTYSDKPSSAAASKLEIRNRATDPAVVEAEKARVTEVQTRRVEARTTAEQKKADNRDLQNQRAANCEKARSYQRTVQNSHRLYELDANGERRYFSSAEQDAAIAKARAQIKEWCDN